MGPFRLVTIGRAFHWMDRAATLAMLDRLIAPDGGVAFFHDAHPDVAENRWFKTLREVTDRYSSRDSGHVAERKAGGHRRYEPFLFASAFTALDGLTVTTRSEITIDEIIGRAYSMSTCAPDKLGDRRGHSRPNCARRSNRSQSTASLSKLQKWWRCWRAARTARAKGKGHEFRPGEVPPRQAV